MSVELTTTDSSVSPLWDLVLIMRFFGGSSINLRATAALFRLNNTAVRLLTSSGDDCGGVEFEDLSLLLGVRSGVRSSIADSRLTVTTTLLISERTVLCHHLILKDTFLEFAII